MPPLPLHLMFGIKYKGCRVVFFAEFLFKPRNLIFHVHTVQRRLLGRTGDLNSVINTRGLTSQNFNNFSIQIRRARARIYLTKHIYMKSPISKEDFRLNRLSEGSGNFVRRLQMIKLIFIPSNLSRNQQHDQSLAVSSHVTRCTLSLQHHSFVTSSSDLTVAHFKCQRNFAKCSHHVLLV